MPKTINKQEKVINISKYSFKDWFSIFFSDTKRYLYPHMCFPNEEVRNEYLQNIKFFSDTQVKDLLRKFIIKTGRIEADNRNFLYLCKLPAKEFDDLLEKSEYYKRNLKIGAGNVWEGLTWVLELLPDHPKMAIQALTAFFWANCQYMTDQQMDSIDDCRSIIRAKYFEIERPNDFLLQIEPSEFETLICKLYQRMGYLATCTKQTYDEGVDVVISKDKIGKKEKSIIQCKRSKNSIGVAMVRELAGTISNFKATKGILITTSDYTYQAELFSERNPRIELINFKKLNYLLNMHFGTEWPNHLDYLIRS